AEQSRAEQSRAEQSRADNIDILKAICAFLIVCIHVPFPGMFGSYFTTLTRIAVPIFFMITGYFYVDVVKRGRENSQIKKLLKLAIEANILYLLWDCFYAVVSRNSDFFQSSFSFKNLLIFLLLNESPLSGHLWYLGAILYTLIIVLIIDKLDCRKILYYLTPLLLFGDLVLGKYSTVILGREFSYILVRNFLFVGIPYFCIGFLIRNGMGRRIEKKALSCLIVAFSVTSILERFLLVNIGMNATRDHYISTTFLAVTVFLFALKYDGHEGFLSAIGRKHSTWLYILHPIFITCLGTVSNKVGIYGVYKYIAPIIVYIATLVFLVIIEKCKNRVLKRRRR
ncbi:acyltransferase family protein, partial [Enterocloster lavalensis]